MQKIYWRFRGKERTIENNVNMESVSFIVNYYYYLCFRGVNEFLNFIWIFWVIFVNNQSIHLQLRNNRTHGGSTSSKLYIRGIVGKTSPTSIENCVSAGKIEHNKNKLHREHFGAFFLWYIYIYCLWTSDVWRDAEDRNRKFKHKFITLKHHNDWWIKRVNREQRR